MKGALVFGERAKWILALAVIPWFVFFIPFDQDMTRIQISEIAKADRVSPGQLNGLAGCMFVDLYRAASFVGFILMIYVWSLLLRSWLVSKHPRRNVVIVAMILFPFVFVVVDVVVFAFGWFNVREFARTAPFGLAHIGTNYFYFALRDLLDTGTWVVSVLVALVSLFYIRISDRMIAKGRPAVLLLTIVYLTLAACSLALFIQDATDRPVSTFPNLRVVELKTSWLALPISMIFSTVIGFWAFITTKKRVGGSTASLASDNEAQN